MFSSFAMLLFTCALAQQDMITEPKSGRTFPAKVSFTYEGKAYNLMATGAVFFDKEAAKTARLTAKAKTDTVSSTKAAAKANASPKAEAPSVILAHYMEQAKPDSGRSVYDLVLEKDLARQMIIVAVQTQPADQIQKGYKRLFKKSLQETEFLRLEEAIDEFLSCFTADLKAKESYFLRIMPDRKLVVGYPNQAEKILESGELGELIWRIWFSSAAGADRASLVSRLSVN
jgi:hypothetical protein